MSTSIFPSPPITETFAFLAVRRAGKSNAAVVMAEEMYRLGLPWVAIDPKGDWWGMRSDRTGKKPGLQIPIFGGLHGDLPLEAEAGAFIAELIVRENLTCVLDASEFPSKAAQMRFLADFAERLYRLHGRHPSPRHIFLEEADEYCMTPDTEILTDSGWATWRDVRVGTVVVAFDPSTEDYRYESVQRLITRQFSGELVHLKTKALDQLVTSDHRVVLRRSQRGAGRERLYDWTFCQAADVPSNVHIPIGGAPSGRGIAELSDELLRIIGWVITDGFYHHRRKSEVIGLEQSNTTRKRGVFIASVMSEVLGRYGASQSTRKPRTTTVPQGTTFGAEATLGTWAVSSRTASTNGSMASSIASRGDSSPSVRGRNLRLSSRGLWRAMAPPPAPTVGSASIRERTKGLLTTSKSWQPGLGSARQSYSFDRRANGT